MAILGKFTKQPAEVMDYEFDFTPWLTDRSDTIVSQTLTSDALTVGATAMTIGTITRTLGVVRFFATGGADGVKYKVTCTVVTTGGRTKQSEMIITVKES